MNNRLIILSVVLLIFGTVTVSAQVPYTIKGYVKDVDGTLVNGINVTVKALNATDLDTGVPDDKSMLTVTDVKGINGFYSISFTFKGSGNYYFKVIAKDTGKSNITYVNSSIPTFIVNLTLVPKGDVDGYPGITMADAMMIGKHAIGKVVLGNPDAADVDGCSGVTINDALYLAKYIIGVPGFADLPAS